MNIADLFVFTKVTQSETKAEFAMVAKGKAHFWVKTSDRAGFKRAGRHLQDAFRSDRDGMDAQRLSMCSEQTLGSFLLFS